MKLLKTLSITILLSLASMTSTTINADPPNAGCFIEGNELWCLVCDPWGCYWNIFPIPVPAPIIENP